MFGIIADLISSVTTILLPIYASYKALRTSDPAQLTPWLLYWVVLSLILLVESWTVFIVGWFPFYSWIRLVLLSYLVLPQTQGAKLIYYNYVEPFIVQHENDIDMFIGQVHEKASAAGLEYLNKMIDLIAEKVLGRAPQSPPPAQSAASYATSLFSRFTMPSARTNIVTPASDLYGMLSGAVAAATAATSNFPSVSSGGRSREMQAESLTVTGGIYPPSMHRETATQAEKMDFIAAQREKLSVLLKALEKEQQSLDLAYGDDNALSQKKSRSTHSFETVEYADAENDGVDVGSMLKKRDAASRRTTSGNWVPSGWWASGGSAAPEGSTEKRSASGSAGWSAARDMTDAIQGSSTGVDR